MPAGHNRARPTAPPGNTRHAPHRSNETPRTINKRLSLQKGRRKAIAQGRMAPRPNSPPERARPGRRTRRHRPQESKAKSHQHNGATKTKALLSFASHGTWPPTVRSFGGHGWAPFNPKQKRPETFKASSLRMRPSLFPGRSLRMRSNRLCTQHMLGTRLPRPCRSHL